MSGQRRQDPSENAAVVRPPRLVSPTPALVQRAVYLQRTAGNRAVGSLMVQRTGTEEQEARKRHLANVEYVADLVANARKLTGPMDEYAVRLHNSARMVMAGTVKMHVLSRPHNQRTVGGRSNWLASNVMNPERVREEWERDGVAGMEKGGEIFIFFTGGDRPAEKIWEIMRHEVQHIVDMHDALDTYTDFTTTEGAIDTNRLTEGSGWTQYVTEFRAHYLQNDKFAHLIGDVERPEEKDYPGADLYTWDKRQFAVFKEIYSDTYDKFKKAWDRECGLPIGQRSLQAKVVQLKRPDSVNPMNSPELHAVYRTFLSNPRSVESPEAALRRLGRRDIAPLREALEHPRVAERLERFGGVAWVKGKLDDLARTNPHWPEEDEKEAAARNERQQLVKANEKHDATAEPDARQPERRTSGRPVSGSSASGAETAEALERREAQEAVREGKRLAFEEEERLRKVAAAERRRQREQALGK